MSKFNDWLHKHVYESEEINQKCRDGVALLLAHDVDTFKCPKCKALWRAEGYFDYEDRGRSYYDFEEGIDRALCPNLCIDFFGFRLKGKIKK